MKSLITLTVLAAVVALAVVERADAQDGWTVTILHSDDMLQSSAFADNGTQQGGWVSVDYFDFNYATHAGFWNGNAASWVELHPEGASMSAVYGISENQQAGFIRYGDVFHACVWNGSAATRFDLNPAGATRSVAYGVSGNKQVGEVRLNNVTRASLWSGTFASWVDLHPAGSGSSSHAYGIAGGEQVGDAFVNGKRRASIWHGTAASWTDLHPPATAASTAYATTGTRQAGWANVGSIIDVVDHASVWSGTPASWVDLNPAGSSLSQAVAASGNYQVGWASVNGVERASLWSGTAASWVDLHELLPAGTYWSYAQGVWSDGITLNISGHLVNESLGSEAVRWSRLICPADLGTQGGLQGHDGLLDNNDFIAFIDLFFNASAAADVGSAGGVAGSDGQFDNNDFIVFIDQFFDGCL